MKNKLSKKISDWLDNFAHKATNFARSSTAFSVAFFSCYNLDSIGPIINFSDTWQLVINTGTII